MKTVIWCYADKGSNDTLMWNGEYWTVRIQPYHSVTVIHVTPDDREVLVKLGVRDTQILIATGEFDVNMFGLTLALKESP